MLNYRKRKVQAFSLIEMSLVLAIMGTIAGLSLPMLLDYKKSQKRQDTLKNIERVLCATGTFAATNSVLPCPASKTSQGQPTICTTNPSFSTGYVPYKALGLSERASKDGFGNPLRYAIDPHLSSHNEFYKNTGTSFLKIMDQNRENVLDLTKTEDKLALVILSEGEAFQEPRGPFEKENVSETLSFVDAPFSSNKASPFRHMVRWSTRNNLLTYYGKSSPFEQNHRPKEEKSQEAQSPQRPKKPPQRFFDPSMDPDISGVF